MKRVVAGFTLLTALCALTMLTPRPARSDDAMAPGIRGDVIGSMMEAGGKIQELAGAMPDKKYDWRPGKGVRSVGEVYLHVCQANYLLPMLMGATPPMSKDELMKMDKMTADKAKIQQMLKDSYAFASKFITDMSDADLDGTFEFFGTKMTKRQGLLVLASHSHEHLGQSIAYARTNGVVPPWTARQEAAEKQAETGKKKS